MNSKRLIVVLGMHRSGTSAVTRALQVMGISLGDRILSPKDDNSKGFFEDVDVNSLNIEMLAAVRSNWHHLAPIESTQVDILRERGYLLRAAEILRGKLDKTQLFAFKDPRVAKLLPFWKEVFDHCQLNVNYVLTIRNPLSVANSLTKRDGFALEKSYLLWLAHVLTSVIESAGRPRVLIDYDRLIEFPDREIERIANALTLEIVPTERAIYKAEFLDKGLRHTVHNIDDLLCEKSCPPLVIGVYRTLLGVASDKMELDGIGFRNHLAGYAKEYSRLKATLVLADKAYSSVAAREQEINSARETINGLAAEIEAARRAHAIRDETERCLRETVTAHEQEINSAREMINGLAAEIEAARRAHAIRDKTERCLRESLAQRVDELECIRKKFAFRFFAKLKML